LIKIIINDLKNGLIIFDEILIGVLL